MSEGGNAVLAEGGQQRGLIVEGEPLAAMSLSFMMGDLDNSARAVAGGARAGRPARRPGEGGRP